MLLGKDHKVVMIGDSITDCERVRPEGEGLWGGPGKGYVAQVDALLGAVYPHLAVRVVNMGCNGHRITELKGRWETDVIALQPDWVSIMVGTNDVWRQFDSPRQKEIHIHLEEYKAIYIELLERTKPHVKGMILMTPFFMDLNRQDAMRAAMDRYSDVVRMLAKEYGAVLVDTQAAFDAALNHCHPAALAWDRVHPNHIGHMILARTFVNALGFAW